MIINGEPVEFALRNKARNEREGVQAACLPAIRLGNIHILSSTTHHPSYFCVGPVDETSPRKRVCRVIRCSFWAQQLLSDNGEKLSMNNVKKADKRQREHTQATRHIQKCSRNSRFERLGGRGVNIEKAWGIYATRLENGM